MEIQKSIIKSALISPNFPNLLGDSHRYATDKGEISLLHPCYATMEMFEIYCTDGELFDDIERYDTLEQAEDRINELLK